MTSDYYHYCMTDFGVVLVGHDFYNKHARHIGEEYEKSRPVSKIVREWAAQAWLAGVRLKRVK